MKLKYQDGLIPAIIQDSQSGKVLMLGYMNDEAFDRTLRSGQVTFYSRSRKKLWTKGETSGHRLLVRDVRVDCDQDALLIQPNLPALAAATWDISLVSFAASRLRERRSFPNGSSTRLPSTAEAICNSASLPSPKYERGAGQQSYGEKHRRRRTNETKAGHSQGKSAGILDPALSSCGL
jgi:phosphoribosyl-AMP cyclohydrolase